MVGDGEFWVSGEGGQLYSDGPKSPIFRLKPPPGSLLKKFGLTAKNGCF